VKKIQLMLRNAGATNLCSTSTATTAHADNNKEINHQHSTSRIHSRTRHQPLAQSMRVLNLLVHRLRTISINISIKRGERATSCAAE
jgi:hypothetical protein